MPWLINAEQLERFRKSQKNLIILDATWYQPSGSKNAKLEFENKHIIGAQFFDIAAFNDPHGNSPNTLLLDEKSICEKVSAIGVRNDYKIIFYDNSSAHTSCRALWMFKMFGHNPNQLYILDGGLNAWEKYGGKVESGESNTSSKQYAVNLQFQYLRTLEQIKSNLHHPKEQIVDVRHPVRFCGGPEGRPGVRSGHIPGSFCFPYTSLYDADGTFLSLDKIRRRLADVSISLKYPIITSCGSGITAPIMNFVLDLLDHNQHAMYNGSWTEWGAEKLYPGESSLDERPIETCID